MKRYEAKDQYSPFYPEAQYDLMQFIKIERFMEVDQIRIDFQTCFRKSKQTAQYLSPIRDSSEFFTANKERLNLATF